MISKFKSLFLLLVFSLLVCPLLVSGGASETWADYYKFDDGDTALNGDFMSNGYNMSNNGGWTVWEGIMKYTSDSPVIDTLSMVGEDISANSVSHTISGTNLTIQVMIYDNTSITASSTNVKLVLRSDYLHQIGVFTDKDTVNYHGYDGGYYSTSITRTDGWHNFTYYYDGSKVITYIDGVVVRNSTNNLVIDKVSLYQRFLNQGSVPNIRMDRFKIWNGTPSNQPQDTPPTILHILNSTLNMTSDGGCTVWRTNKATACNTTDGTPTVTFNTNVASNCSFRSVSGNYNASHICSSTGGTTHVCTLYNADKLSYGLNNVYASCYDGTTQETSGAMNINMTAGQVGDCTIGSKVMNGTVVDSGGTGIASADVVIFGQSSHTTIGYTTTNASGRWACKLEPGVYVSVAYYPTNISQGYSVIGNVTVT